MVIESVRAEPSFVYLTKNLPNKTGSAYAKYKPGLMPNDVALTFENLVTSSRYFSELKDLSLDGLAM